MNRSMRTLALMMLVLPLMGQTTLRLRYGGSRSTYRITSISHAAPLTLTVTDAENHAAQPFRAGDDIYIHGVQGCAEANGYGKVTAAGSSNFSITASDGTAIHCSDPFDYTNRSGFVGKYQTLTLNPHPRLMAPQTGELRDRLVDNGSPARMAKEHGAAWQAILTRNEPHLSSSCDGVTPSKCSSEVKGISTVYAAYWAFPP